MKYDVFDWLRVHNQESFTKYQPPMNIPKYAAQGKKNTKKGGKKK